MMFSRRVFLIAGIYGLIVLAPQYFMETQFGRDYPPPIAHPVFFYGFTGVALAWQVAFLVISRDPVRYRLLMVPAMLEKASFGIAAICLLIQQRIPMLVFGFACVDLLLLVLFAIAFKLTPRSPIP